METKEVTLTPELAKVLSDYGHLLINRTFMGYTLSSGLTVSGMFAYIAG